MIDFEVEENLVQHGYRTEEKFEKYKKQLSIKEQFTLLKDEGSLIVALTDKVNNIKFSRFTHDFEEHTNILYIEDMDDEEYSINPDEMYIYKVIGTVVAILPRVIQDKKEKDVGLFNRRLKSLHDWKEYDEEI